MCFTIEEAKGEKKRSSISLKQQLPSSHPYDLHLLLPLPHVSRHSSDHHEPPVTNQSANVLRPLANLFIWPKEGTLSGAPSRFLFSLPSSGRATSFGTLLETLAGLFFTSLGIHETGAEPVLFDLLLLFFLPWTCPMQETFGEVGSLEAKVIPLLVFLLDSGGNIRIIGPAAFLGLGGGLWNVITAGCAAFDRNVKILLPIRFNGFSIDLIVVIFVYLYIHIQYIYMCVCIFVYLHLYTQKCL